MPDSANCHLPGSHNGHETVPGQHSKQASPPDPVLDGCEETVAPLPQGTSQGPTTSHQQISFKQVMCVYLCTCMVLC